MKYLVVSFALLSILPIVSHSSEDSLTAVELAHHLGVASWVSSLRLQGTDVELKVLHVKNGRVVGAILVGSAVSTDRERTRVAIEASRTALGTKFSLETPGGPWLGVENAASIPLETILPLPALLMPGDYILGGDIDPDRVGEGKTPVEIDDIKDGMLLRISKKG
jgi:hypothetical protein